MVWSRSKLYLCWICVKHLVYVCHQSGGFDYVFLLVWTGEPEIGQWNEQPGGRSKVSLFCRTQPWPDWGSQSRFSPKEYREFMMWTDLLYKPKQQQEPQSGWSKMEWSCFILKLKKANTTRQYMICTIFSQNNFKLFFFFLTYQANWRESGGDFATSGDLCRKSAHTSKMTLFWFLKFCRFKFMVLNLCLWIILLCICHPETGKWHRQHSPAGCGSNRERQRRQWGYSWGSSSIPRNPGLYVGENPGITVFVLCFPRQSKIMPASECGSSSSSSCAPSPSYFWTGMTVNKAPSKDFTILFKVL